MGRVTPTPTAASAINLSRPFPDVSDPRFPISSAAKRCKVKSTRRNRAGLFVVTADFRALAPRSARARSRPDTATFGYWQVHPIRSVSLLFSLILAVIAIVSSSWIHLAVMRWVSVGMCHCTLINQILRFQGILEQFCTLNCNISTGCSLQDLTPFERFQISSARIRSA